MTVPRTTRDEIKRHLISGDYEIEGNVKFDSREYYTKTSHDAVREAGKDGLFRLTGVNLREEQ